MIKLILMENKKVEINNEKWICEEDKQFQDMLNLKYTSDKLFYSVFIDYDLAEIAIKEWGGRIVEVTNPPKYVEGRIY